MDDSLLKAIKRLSDLTGLLAFYPVFLVVSVLLGSLTLLLSSEIYFLVLLVVSIPYLYLAQTLVKNKVKQVLSVIILSISVAVGVIVLVFPVSFNSLITSEFLLALSKLVAITMYALVFFDVSKVLNMQETLGKYSGLIVLGSFLLVVRLLITIFIGLLLLAVGFGNISQNLRKVYYQHKKSK